MKQAGQVVLFKFPQTNLVPGKLRPAILLSRLPGSRDDWLICMMSTQVHQAVPQFDEVIHANDADFRLSGLRGISLIRLGRLAVVEGRILVGALGQISPTRLQRLKSRLVAWLAK